MKLRPLGSRVIVKPASKEEIRASGLIVPDTATKERSEQGEVIEVGPGDLREDGTRASMSVKVGDTVIFKKYAPDEFKLEEVEYLVLAEKDIIAVLEN